MDINSLILFIFIFCSLYIQLFLLLTFFEKEDIKNTDIKDFPTVSITVPCFNEAKTLHWIKEVLDIGYISHRSDGMSELRINGYIQVKEILKKLLPYIRFKAIQAKSLLEATEILSNTKFRMLEKKQLLLLVKLALLMQQENYVTKKKKTKEELLAVLGLTP
jgi:cellulose synthase/poly-beta-1,6-N-acetylglucosamine synthase-like glycosyltransferase